MKMSLIKCARFFRLSMVFSLLSSSAILISMMDVSGSKEFAFVMAASSIFWIGLILEQFFFWRSAGMRKNIMANAPPTRITYTVGIISFCKTKIGSIADLVLVISLISYIVLVIGNWGTDVLQFIFLFLIVFSFRFHCLANGKNYRYLLYMQRRRAKYEVDY